MKNINTLIPDIYNLFKGEKYWFDTELSKELAFDVSERLYQSINTDRRPTLRLSKMGPVCPRALWYSIHKPELAEPVPPWAQIKFLYGHFLEALAIVMAKASGHTVEGEQDEIILDGVVGHRDCVIDGCVVDVKSLSSIAFKKFQDKSIAQNDSFGYLDQLDGYVVGCSEDPLVTCKDKGYILGIDKTLGKLVLYEHGIRETGIRERIRLHQEIVNKTEEPACRCRTIPEGKSGNIRLDVVASYSAFKYSCFPQLRAFLYSGGPVFLTTVKRLPDVPELNREGKIIQRFN